MLKKIFWVCVSLTTLFTFILIGCSNAGNTLNKSLQSQRTDISPASQTYAVTATSSETPLTIVTPTNNNIADDKMSTVDSIRKKIMSFNIKPLTDEDFIIAYKNNNISTNTDVYDVMTKLGIPERYEDNNNGYISGNSSYRRWNLCYPNYENPEIRMIVLSERKYNGDEVKDGKSYIVGVYLDTYKTARGLSVNDSVDTVLKLYGRPENFHKDTATDGKLYFMHYSMDKLHIDITLNEEINKVKYIFIDYTMEKSLKDQGIIENSTEELTTSVSTTTDNYKGNENSLTSTEKSKGEVDADQRKAIDLVIKKFNLTYHGDTEDYSEEGKSYNVVLMPVGFDEKGRYEVRICPSYYPLSVFTYCFVDLKNGIISTEP